MSGITIGNMVSIKESYFGTDKTWTQVAANTTAEQTATLKGLRTSDFILITKPTHQAGLGYVATARCATAGVITVKFTNPTAAGITPTAEEQWKAVVFRAELPVTNNADI